MVPPGALEVFQVGLPYTPVSGGDMGIGAGLDSKAAPGAAALVLGISKPPRR